MEFISAVILLLFTFYGLARVVDLFFVESLELISKKLKLSSDIAGATFMAIGSSAPELFVSFLALFRVGDQQAIGAGTIVGSAIFNILVIIGASAMVKRALLTWQPVIRDLVFYCCAILLLLFTFKDGQITLFDSVLFILFYIIYIFSFGIWKKLFPYQTKGDIDQEVIEDAEESHKHIKESSISYKNIFDKFLSLFFVNLKKNPSLFFVNFLISVLLIGVLSHFMVESAVEIAHFMGIPDVVIGLTILAAGTSIPDLLSSIKVAKTGRGDMAIANAVGSNIFDIAIGLGLPWLIITLFRDQTVPVVTENLTSSIILLFATVVALLYLMLMKKWKMGKYGGLLLIGGYLLYLLTQIGIFSVELCVHVQGVHCFVL